MADDDDRVLALASAWQSQGRELALATVVSCWGSAPRPVGSHLVIDSNGDFVGSVSGGCVEGAVVRQAVDVIRDRRPRILEFGVSDADAWQVGLACGGAIRVHLSPMAGMADLFARLSAIRADGGSAALVEDLTSGRRILVPADGTGAGGDLPLPAEILARVRDMMSQGLSGEIAAGTTPIFVRSYTPAWSMIIVGAVHITQILAPMARLAGFEVTVIDPRRAFATDSRFPDVTLTADWPDTVMAEMPPGPQTAVIAVTHDPKIDDPALGAALRSPAFYVGALGSSRTHARRRDRLRADGFSETDLARIAGPIGLDLGGRLPAEIAVSILAEVIATRHGRPRVPR